MMKKKAWLLIITTLCIVLLIFYRLDKKAEDEKIKPKGEMITIDDINHDLHYYIDNRLKLIQIDITPLPNNKKVIQVNTKIKSPKNNKADIFEVKEAIRVWLYFFEREEAFSIESISVGVEMSKVMAKIQTVQIDKMEFVDLYNQFKDTKLTDDEKIKKISDKWMEIHKYQPWWMKEKEENGNTLVYP